MSTSIQTFQNGDFGTIRTLTINDEPWFVGKDVAEILGYERPTKTVVDHVDEDDRLMLDGKTQSQFGIELGQRGGWIINESGLYSLILSSKLPTAKQFKRWVTSEVLPAIRKNGYYSFFKEGKEQTIIRDRESRSRIAEIWLALSDKVKSETYQQICISYASKELAGQEVIPLPLSTQHHYSAGEVGKMFGVSAHKIGMIAKRNNMKTEMFGCWYHDKSPYSNREVDTFRYNNAAIERFRELL